MKEKSTESDLNPLLFSRFKIFNIFILAFLEKISSNIPLDNYI